MSSKFWVNGLSETPQIIPLPEGHFACYVVENPETFGLSASLVADYANQLAGTTGAAHEAAAAEIEADADLMAAIVTTGWVAVTMENNSPRFHAANLRPVRAAITALRDAGIMTV